MHQLCFTRALRDELLAEPAVVPAIRLELIKPIHDCMGWAAVVVAVHAARPGLRGGQPP